MADDTEVEARLPSTLNPWQGIHEEIFADATDELDVEGARMCAKTTLLLDKEIHFLKRYPGIHTFICRYTDIATKTKLKPRFEALCKVRGFTDYGWNSEELAYEFANGSKCYAFGLKAANQNERYDKIRGLDVSRVYNDQTESTPADIGQELRASLRQKGFPHQLTFSPNPPGTDHWLADERHGGFPTDNSLPNRKYYRLTIDDNAYNLDPADIERMKRTYPPDHAKHGAMILGKRGFNVIGDPIFEDTFNRELHLRSIRYDPQQPMYEGFSAGKYNAVWVVAQRLYAGGLALLGGIIGQRLFLEDFLPIVAKHRDEWFPDVQKIRTCCPPPGSGNARFTCKSILQRAKLNPKDSEGANGADVQLALLEQLATYMRRRNAMGEECFAINNDPNRWLKFERQGHEPWPFMAQAFEAGAVWDEHNRSVNNNTVRQMKDDDWFSNVVSCVQHIEINFCASRKTPAERDDARRKTRMGRPPNSTPSGSASWLAS